MCIFLADDFISPLQGAQIYANVLYLYNRLKKPPEYGNFHPLNDIRRINAEPFYHEIRGQ
jgi:hypothetical protein